MMGNGVRTPESAGRSVMAHARTRTITFVEAYGLAAEVQVEVEEEDGERGRHQGWFNIATTRGIDLLQHRECDKEVHINMSQWASWRTRERHNATCKPL
eukprot:COSAG02_NODE_1319_length_13272_cov_10.015714_9_plen_99_part_00